MKHILIDARLYGPKHTGIGRYTKNLLQHLVNCSDFTNYKFSLLVYPELHDEIKKDLGDNFNLITTNIRHYSIAEQLLLPITIYKINPNLVHFTNFNKPVLYFPKSVITVHDLIKHFSKGADTTTRHKSIYWIKYFFYLLFTNFNIKNNYVIVPSFYWQEYLQKNFNLNSKRIITTHEAIDPQFITTNQQSDTPPQPYFIYTGNLYPHKNIEIIFKVLPNFPKYSLKIICPRSAVFEQRTSSLIKKYQVENQVQIMGYVPDSEFKKIYSNATCLIHPSFMEGFSLTGLESMALGCPVISSNASCLPEIYGDATIYFQPDSPESLIQAINKLISNPSLRQKLIKLGYSQISKYSWDKTADQTFSFYKKFL